MVEDTNRNNSAAESLVNPTAENPSGEIGPENVRIWEDEFRQLHLKVGEREFGDVRVVRVFPISGKTDLVCFLDWNGKEIALLAHPHKLDKTSRNALAMAFDRMYYVPKITRMLSVTETFGMSRWEVMTDRGYAAFEMTDREGIRKEPHGRYLIHDPDGNRYEIEDLSKLDSHSRAMLQSEL